MKKEINKNINFEDYCKQERDRCLSQLPEKTVQIIEMLERDRRIIEKIIDEKIYPKSRYSLDHEEYMKLFMAEIKKMNEDDKWTRRLN